MTMHECTREQDVVDAVATGRWPERADQDLHTHVATCDLCADMLAVLSPLNDDWAASRGAAHVPASGMVWWRAQMRARQEAARAATRPITVAQVVGGVVALGGIAMALLLLAPWLTTGLTRTPERLGPGVATSEAFSLGWLLAIVIAAVAATSLAIYLAVAED